MDIHWLLLAGDGWQWIYFDWWCVVVGDGEQWWIVVGVGGTVQSNPDFRTAQVKHGLTYAIRPLSFAEDKTQFRLVKILVLEGSFRRFYKIFKLTNFSIYVGFFFNKNIMKLIQLIS